MPDNDPVLNCASGACCRLGSPEQTEALAQVLHESGRAAVEKGATVAATKFGDVARSFVEWVDLDEAAKEGRRIQARYLTELGLIGLPIANGAFARWVQWSLTPPASNLLGGAASPNAGPE